MYKLHHRLGSVIALASILATGAAHASSTASGSLCISISPSGCGDLIVAEPLIVHGLDIPVSPNASISIMPDWLNPHSSLREHAVSHDGSGHRTDEARGWSRNDAEREVEKFYKAHGHHFDGHDDQPHGWHDWKGGDGHCDDDGDPPHPTPLPAAALLFGPALLMLRSFQRRAA
jgi:hypothetical protein